MQPAMAKNGKNSESDHGRTPELSGTMTPASHTRSREQTKIVVVDPHPYTAEGLRVLLGSLTQDMEIVATADDLDKALAQIRRHFPDLLIIDPQMPRMMSGIKAIRELSDKIKIIAWASHEERRQSVEAIQRGAHAYISKRTGPEDLVHVLQVVRSGRMVVSESVIGALSSGSETDSGGGAILTVRDRKLLGLIIEGLDNNEIARRLAVSESTLKRNIHQLLRKMKAHNRIQAAVRAASKGLLEEV